MLSLHQPLYPRKSDRRSQRTGAAFLRTDTLNGRSFFFLLFFFFLTMQPSSLSMMSIIATNTPAQTRCFALRGLWTDTHMHARLISGSKVVI
jgi:hypothetical protein